MNISIYHNILWSKYKAGVFSEIFRQSQAKNIDAIIIQIAETDSDRSILTGVDLSYHKYPFQLLFAGAYSAIPQLDLVKKLFGDVWNSNSKMILLPGFHTLEFWAMLLAAKMRGKVVAVFCDSTEYDKPQTWFKSILKRLFFSSCDAFFCYGQRSHHYLKLHGAHPAHIYFRRQAAALPHDYDASLVPQQRVAMASNVNEPRFLYVGRLSPEKGLDTQLRAIALVLQKIPAAKLVLVGSGPSKAALEALSGQLGLTNSVEFAGSKDVDALREEYLKASCFVLPSTSEPWGLVVNEALAYGCPVVVSHRCGCVPELVINGVTGYVFTASDANDLAKKMIQVVTEFADPVEAANRCLSVISTYTPEAAARQILDGCKATFARLQPNA